MKRILVSLFLIVSMATLFSATIDPFKVQTISGFIDDISYLYVSPFTFDYIGKVGYAGINLDTSDDTEYKELIKATTPALSMPGVQIGSFSVLATWTQSATIQGARLTITHTKLIHTTEENTELEYELAVLYAIGNGTEVGEEQRKFCLSSDANPNNNKIVIDLVQSTKIAAIQNGHLYFRLAQGVTPSVAGQYESVVTFMMEAI